MEVENNHSANIKNSHWLSNELFLYMVKLFLEGAERQCNKRIKQIYLTSSKYVVVSSRVTEKDIYIYIWLNRIICWYIILPRRCIIVFYMQQHSEIPFKSK